MNEELLTAKDAAALLGISLAAFYALRRRHGIPNRGRGRSLRFYAKDLVKEAPPVADFAEMGRQHARMVAREASR